ncbi:MAG: non-canonical purine NTP diphosphatase [Bacteroidetes bacterium]|nr:non-canonical purine NTP diphosphatase [Bacteroidota bacterium]
MKLLFATNNPNKVEEIRRLLNDQFELFTLSDVGWEGDIEETGTTIEENAVIKSRAVADKFSMSCFSDDSGLEVEALNGAPGVNSARYADKENPSPQKNMIKLLEALEGKDNRRARFKTVIALIVEDRVHQFEGIINGTITKERRGKGGFGYDPIFQPEGYDVTFAEMPLEEKNQISHRRLAFEKLCNFLLMQC